MPTNAPEASRLEQLAVLALNALQRVGLGKLAYSHGLRWIGKRLFLRNEEGPAVRMIASGLGKHLKVQVLPETPRSYWMGAHEPLVQTVLRDHIKPGMVVYDCGANIGYFSVILAKLVGPQGRVYAFEPSPESLECLKLAPMLNGFDHLKVIPKAVWRQNEVLQFVQGGPKTSLVSDHIEGVFGEPAPTQFVRVEAISLDEFVYAGKNPRPDFIKMDVEGSEGHALTGASRILSEIRPCLLLEIHGFPGHEVWKILKGSHYQATNIATGRTPQSPEEFAIWISQYLAVPN